jgi:hypothetical protein
MWGTIVFRLGGTTEVRKRSNKTWLKIDYGQLHIRIKNMWLTGVYFVLPRKFWHRSDRPCSSEGTRPSSRSCAAVVNQRALEMNGA